VRTGETTCFHVFWSFSKLLATDYDLLFARLIYHLRGLRYSYTLESATFSWALICHRYQDNISVPLVRCLPDVKSQIILPNVATPRQVHENTRDFDNFLRFWLSPQAPGAIRRIFTNLPSQVRCLLGFTKCEYGLVFHLD
jgi:hypothetical protein